MKRKKLHSRKEKALRRVALAVALLLAVNYVQLGFYLFPAQALWESREYYGLTEMKVIHREDLTFLSEGEEALHLAVLDWDFPWGWFVYSGSAIDCAGDGAVHAAWEYRESTGDQESIAVFGRVDDQNVRSIEIYFREYEKLLEEGQTPHTARFTVDEFIKTENGRCFLTFFEWEKDTCIKTLIAYDAEGNVVEQQELARGW